MLVTSVLFQLDIVENGMYCEWAPRTMIPNMTMWPVVQKNRRNGPGPIEQTGSKTETFYPIEDNHNLPTKPWNRSKTLGLPNTHQFWQGTVFIRPVYAMYQKDPQRLNGWSRWQAIQFHPISRQRTNPFLLELLPVVPHKAVVEVSKKENL